MSRRFEYDHMTPAQFKVALAELSMRPVYFAKISGANVRQVERYLTGEVDIPHWVTCSTAC